MDSREWTGRKGKDAGRGVVIAGQEESDLKTAAASRAGAGTKGVKLNRESGGAVVAGVSHGFFEY